MYLSNAASLVKVAYAHKEFLSHQVMDKNVLDTTTKGYSLTSSPGRDSVVTSVTTGSETTSECHSTADEDDDKHCLKEEDDNDEEQDKHSSVETGMEEADDDDYNVPSNTVIKTALQTSKRDTELLRMELENAIKSSLDYEWKYSERNRQRQNGKIHVWKSTKRLSQLEAVLEINMEETWDDITVQQQEIMVARQHKDHLQKRLESCQ
jgi:hypothetical protein